MDVYQIPSTSLGHEVYGTDYRDYQADGGNVMSCSGDNNFMRGGGSGDDIFCVGNGCDVDGREGDDNVAVVNPDAPCDPNQPYPPECYTNFIQVRSVSKSVHATISCFSSGRRRRLRHVHVQRGQGRLLFGDRWIHAVGGWLRLREPAVPPPADLRQPAVPADL